MNVHKIVEMARVYSEMDWRDWGTSDLAEIHAMLISLSLKYPIRYTIEALQDQPTKVEEG